jgi:hypothetical protein
MHHRLWPVAPASVAVAVAVALPMSAALARGERQPKCAIAQLTISVGHSFAADRVAGANIRFTNRSSRACWLRGWPTLAFQTKPQGRPTRAKAAPDTLFADVKQIGDPLVLLRPGQRADAIFDGADGPLSGTGTCGPAFKAIRVTPPGDTQHATVSAWIAWLGAYMPACSQIRVSPILPSSDVYKG